MSLHQNFSFCSIGSFVSIVRKYKRNLLVKLNIWTCVHNKNSSLKSKETPRKTKLKTKHLYINLYMYVHICTGEFSTKINCRKSKWRIAIAFRVLNARVLELVQGFEQENMLN